MRPVPRMRPARPVPGPRTARPGPSWLTTLASAAGPVITVRPPGELDGERLTWREPLSRYGGDEAAWALPDRDQGEVGLAEQAVVAAQPVRAVLVDSGPDPGRPGMIAVGREPLLLVALVAGLEVLPLLRVAVSIQAGRKPAATARSTRPARSPNSAAVVPGHIRPVRPRSASGARTPRPSSTRPPGLTSRRSSASAAARCAGGSISVSAWLAPTHSTRSAGPRGGPDGGLADERGPVAEPPGPGAGPAPGQVTSFGIQAEAGRRGHRREDAEHQLAPAAADVEHGSRAGSRRAGRRSGPPWPRTAGRGRSAGSGPAGVRRQP